MTPLHHAVDRGYYELVKMLIQDESDLEITDIVSFTCLLSSSLLYSHSMIALHFILQL